MKIKVDNEKKYKGSPLFIIPYPLSQLSDRAFMFMHIIFVYFQSKIFPVNNNGDVTRHKGEILGIILRRSLYED